MPIYMKKNDRLPIARFTLKDAQGNVVNIAGTTARFIMRNRVTGVVKVNAAATVTDGANGKVEYPWVAGDTDTPSLYDGEIEVTDGAGKKMTFPNDGYIDVVVTDEIG